MNTNLKNTVLIGKLSITNWEAKKKAKSVERAAESAAGATSGTISARKALLPGAEALEDILKHSAAMRTWWNTVSAPWFDNGMRAYNVAGHMDIVTAYGDMARHRELLINEFLDEYPALREQARFSLNDLFDEADYPLPEVVKARFTHSFECMPLPDTADFRVVEGVDPAELARLQADAEARAQARVQEAMGATVMRLTETLRTLADRLARYSENETAQVKGNRFYESWVDNVKELAGLLPQLNLVGDPTIAAVTAEIEQVFDKPALHYRDSFEDRTAATKKATELSARLAALFAAD
jgi:hypothetical protein